MKTKVIEIALYHHTLQILFGDKNEIRSTLVKKYKAKNEGIDEILEGIGDAIGAYIYHDNEYYVWMPKVPETIKDYGVLVHELQHMTFHFLDHKGLTHSSESDEAYSYLLEYLYMETADWITQLNKEDKKEGK